jgi:transcriptional regulator with XRE-family HTH domain
MMEKSNNYWYAMSDPAILKYLGGFLKQTRLRQNKTQTQVATSAGINRSTLIQMEKDGRGTLLTFVQVLRTLEQLYLLQQFEMQNTLSPLMLAKLDKKKRQRASTKPIRNTTRKSDW